MPTRPGGHSFISVANVATAQGIPPRLSMAQAQQDLDVARRSLEEAHGALYRFTPKPELDRTFDNLRARANQEMSRREFIDLVNELLAATGDGHARRPGRLNNSRVGADSEIPAAGGARGNATHGHLERYARRHDHPAGNGDHLS